MIDFQPQISQITRGFFSVKVKVESAKLWRPFGQTLIWGVAGGFFIVKIKDKSAKIQSKMKKLTKKIQKSSKLTTDLE